MILKFYGSQREPQADLRKGPMEAANDFELSHRQLGSVLSGHGWTTSWGMGSDSKFCRLLR